MPRVDPGAIVLRRLALAALAALSIGTAIAAPTPAYAGTGAAFVVSPVAAVVPTAHELHIAHLLHLSHLAALARQSRAQRVLAYALAQRGKPYRWGAAGPNSFDCSGLVMASYARVGIKLPHYTGALLGRGVRVARSSAAPG